MEMPGESSHNGLCDDALVEILVRLPSEAVLRCRAVSKRWRRITTDPSFLAAHAASCTREMIILPRKERSAVKTIPLSLYPRSRDDRRRRFLCDRSQRAGDGTLIDWYDLLYSLDGLLVLEQRPGLYIICNPMTRQSTNLPVLTPEPCFTAFPCGFYFHRSSDEYRLLCHCLEGETEEARGTGSIWHRERYYYILSAGNALPRRLGCAPTPTHQPPTTQYDLPVAHRGILHWFSLHPEATRTGKMLAFDTVSETFRLMSRPPERAADTTRNLLELDGELAVAAMQGLRSLDIWVLQDYKMESWTLRHRIEVPLSRLYCERDVSVSMVISAGSGSILIGGTILIGNPCCYVGRLYDLKDRILRRDFDFGFAAPTFQLFTESLVPHAFFDSPHCPKLMSIKFSS